jgi:hypothetical protein
VSELIMVYEGIVEVIMIRLIVTDCIEGAATGVEYLNVR